MEINRKKQRGRKSKYSDSFKRQVAREYLVGQETMQEIANRFELPSRWIVKEFVKWFESQSDDSPPATALSDSEKQDVEALRKRISDLEKQLDNAQLRALGFETMIDIAEKELRIEIRKKSDTKPSQP